MSPLKKLKDPFVKVESICLFVPIIDNFQYKKYSYLICLLYWCYALFKFCPFVHNVPNDHHRTANIYNNITCTDIIAALENRSIIYTPICKVLIMTGFNFFCINVCYRALWNVPEIALCTLRRSLGPQIVSPSGRRLNTISHTVFLPGLKEGKVLIWEKGTFVRCLSFWGHFYAWFYILRAQWENNIFAYLKRKQYNYDLNII